MQESAEKIISRLSRLEDILLQLDRNTRDSDHDVRPIKRTEIDGKQITVYIRCNIIQVGEIRNVEQEYTAQYYLSARYLEPMIPPGQCADDINWEEHWDPRLEFPNLVDMRKMVKKVYFNEELSDERGSMVVKSYRIIGTFKERLELNDFPFDSQALNLVIKSDWPGNDIKFERDEMIKDSLNITDFVDSQTWDLLPHVIARPVEVQKDVTGSHRKYPTYVVTCNVVRRVGYYFWNIALVMGFIMSLTFASFAVPITETGDRLGVTVTLLLTAVAFKFVVSQNLPTISYLTLLDVYVLVCMGIQVFIAVQNSVSAIWTDASQAETGKMFDMITGVVLAAIVFIFHVIFLIICLVKIHVRDKVLNEHTEKYNDLCAKINEDFQERQRKKDESNGKKKPKRNQIGID